MKMLAAWDSLKEENRMLKILILILSVTAIVPTVSVVVLAGKAPLVIERGCVSQSNLHCALDLTRKSTINKC